MSIGENIKQLRTEKHLTQKELAERIGVNQSMIAQIERGSKVPTMPLGKEISDALKCDLDRLMTE